MTTNQQGYMTGSVCLFVRMITQGYKETGVKILPEVVLRSDLLFESIWCRCGFRNFWRRFLQSKTGHYTETTRQHLDHKGCLLLKHEGCEEIVQPWQSFAILVTLYFWVKGTQKFCQGLTTYRCFMWKISVWASLTGFKFSHISPQPVRIINVIIKKAAQRSFKHVASHSVNQTTSLQALWSR